ncbi:MAG: hypothetical protein E7021_03765 [Alphaproteobacteria bacterium]|nr:hypothetical protein [Alphaproteobacteria bacterium]
MPLDIVQSVQKTLQKYDWDSSLFHPELAGHVRYLKNDKSSKIWQSYCGDCRGVAMETDKERLALGQAVYYVDGKPVLSYSIVSVPTDKEGGFNYRAVVIGDKKQTYGRESYVHRFIHKHPEFPVVLSQAVKNVNLQKNQGR